MKNLATLFLISIILFQSMTKLSIVAYFHLNKSYISSVLCENISKPKLLCHGKCYLEKKLKSQQKSEQKTPSFLKNTECFNLFFGESTNFKVTLNFFTFDLLKTIYLFKLYNPGLSGIFQPPQ